MRRVQKYNMTMTDANQSTVDAARSGVEVNASTTMPKSGGLIRQEPYRGRTPGPYVQGTSWRTWWEHFSIFFDIEKGSGRSETSV